ncbi:MAG: hypothetical protein HY608_09225 [Planctomycetes bacterium]|nr:hypothetical protein [Planctomycetota bacterium]
MNGRKAFGIGLISVGVVGLGWLGGRMWWASGRVAALERDLADARAAAARDVGVARSEAAAARQEAARLSVDIARAEAAEREARQALTEALAAATPPPPAVASASAAQPRVGGMRGMMGMAKEMWENPAMRDQMRAGVRMQVGMLYGDLLGGWALDPQSCTEVTELLTGRMLGKMELGFLVMDENVSEDEILRRQEEATARSQEGMAARLSSMQIAQVDAYEREIPRHMAARAVDQEIAGLGLDPAQRETVRAILLEERIGSQDAMQTQFGGAGAGMNPAQMTRESIRQARAMLAGDGTGPAMGDALRGMQESNERALERVRPVLTSEQFDRLKRQRDAEQQMMQMAMRMFDGGEE